MLSSSVVYKLTNMPAINLGEVEADTFHARKKKNTYAPYF